MDFALTPEQQMLRDLCREFAVKEVSPHAEAFNNAHRFPVEIFRKMGELGLMGLMIPEAYGGSDVGAMGTVLALEEIGKADQSVGAALSAHLSIGALPFLQFGTEEQKQRWLVPLARGEVLGAFALTEPGAGSDARGIETTAVLDGDQWVINGTKCFITNAGTEMSYGVVALVTTGRRPDGKKRFSAMVVPRDAPGYRQGPNYDKVGWWAADTREQIFEDCRVPRDHLVGPEGAGLRQFLSALEVGRVTLGALAVGLAAAVMELSVEHARQRHQFGQPISKFQAIQFKLADMAVQVETARLMCYKAAWLHDQGLPYSKEAAIAKLYASEAAIRCAEEAVQIHGGYGWINEYPVSRFYRDSKILTIGEGSSEVQRILIARQLGC